MSHHRRSQAAPTFILVAYSDLSHLQLGSKGDLGILLFPSPKASSATRPLPWDLFAFKVAGGK